MNVNSRRPYKVVHTKIMDNDGVLIASFNPNCEDSKQIQEFVVNALNGGSIPLEDTDVGTWLAGIRKINAGKAVCSN